MAHVLIDGESRRMQEIYSCLRRWGLTVGRLPADAAGRGRASRAECDLVVFVCDEDHGADEPRDTYLKSVPAASTALPAEPGADAPLLVVGAGPLAEIMGRQARCSIAQPGPDGALLYEALENCLNRDDAPRRGDACRDRDQQLHFLGHELRSPLTAIKTALEVMQGDAWRPDCGGDAAPVAADSGLRMVEIALRNVRRMHYSVEWSQNLMKFEDERRSLRRRSVTVEALRDALAAAGCDGVEASGVGGGVECDADVFLHVARQAVLAARCDDPERRLSLSLRVESGEPGRLRLDILREADADAEDDGEMAQHLQRFADFLNPARVLLGAGCSVALQRGDDGAVGLCVAIECRCGSTNRFTLVG